MHAWHILSALISAEFTLSGASVADKAAARAVAATLAASGDSVAINYIDQKGDDARFFQTAEKACAIRGVAII